MANIFRYSSVVAQPKRTVASTAATAKSSQPCTECNYSNNYYGDQVCVVAPR